MRSIAPRAFCETRARRAPAPAPAPVIVLAAHSTSSHRPSTVGGIVTASLVESAVVMAIAAALAAATTRRGWRAAGELGFGPSGARI